MTESGRTEFNRQRKFSRAYQIEAMATVDEKTFRSRITIQCESFEQADIMCQVLSVDEELQPNKLILKYSTNKDSMTEDPPQLFVYVRQHFLTFHLYLHQL